jgi:hypothetical protein
MEACSRNELRSNIKEDFSDEIKKVVWSERWIGKE